MATEYKMTNLATGEVKTGFVGYSWTTLFFGPLPALFRGDYITFIGYAVIASIISVATYGVGIILGSLVWSFFYNPYYTKKLVNSGFKFSIDEHGAQDAASELGLDPKLVCDGASLISQKDAYMHKPRDIDDKSYQLFLVSKFKIEKNDVLGVFGYSGKAYDTLKDALLAAHAEYEEEANPPKEKIPENKVTRTGTLGSYHYTSYEDGKCILKSMETNVEQAFQNFDHASIFVANQLN